MRFLTLMLGVALAGCVNPRSEAATAQALNDAANEMAGLRNDVGQLQMDLDSLKQVVARQDSLLNKISAAIPH